MLRLSLIVLALVLGGCATAKQPVEANRLAAIENGKTTRAEVEASLGKPMLISTLTDGKYFVAYMLRIKPAQADAEPESRFITLRYDRNGVVQDLDDKESNSFISVSAGSGAAAESQSGTKASKAEEPKVKRKPFVWPENTTPNR